jgi:hypothetical protein
VEVEDELVQDDGLFGMGEWKEWNHESHSSCEWSVFKIRFNLREWSRGWCCRKTYTICSSENISKLIL